MLEKNACKGRKHNARKLLQSRLSNRVKYGAVIMYQAMETGVVIPRMSW